MDRSSECQAAMKRPKRNVQSKLSFCVSPQASRQRSVATSPDVVGDDEGSDSERKYKDKRRRNRKIKRQDGDYVEYADNVKEANELNGQRKKIGDKKSKSKQSGGETPRKNKTPIKRMLNCKSNDVKECDGGTETFCDLWSEAKKAAEENLRLSAGKQTHPFFSICKATKRLSEAKNAEKSQNSSFLIPDGDFCISFPPVHVFDTVKDVVAAPNWEKWTFLETGLPKIHGHCSMKISSSFDVSTNSLMVGTACGNSTKVDDTYMETSSSKFSSKPLQKEQQPSQLERQVHVACNISCSSTHGNGADKDQDKMHKGRLASYYQRCIHCLGCSLWTEKYRPEISLEVCGNAESVKLLSEWLKSWQEKGVQNIGNENSLNQSTVVDSEGSSYVNYSEMDDVDDGDFLKNVLLISGPAGSGKSAAIYACAREQGFKVIEVNASSLRNGAYMRQTFGEGVDSLGLTHWLAVDQTNQQTKDIKELLSSIPVVENNSHFNIANKTLILFEEVDIVFDEDHGFVSMILKLAETTKRPIILTSNTKRPVLPHLLDRLVLNFKAPSYTELLYHASMVCAFENVHISLSLLEHIISSCVGDIRRILMLLQFWCQGFQDITEKVTQCTKSLEPFDIAALHLAIPKVIPWGFRCELSEKVEEEIGKAVSATEENATVSILLQYNAKPMEIIDPFRKVNTTSGVKIRKERKLRKHSIIIQTESSEYMNSLQDLYDSDSPSTCFQKASKRKRRVMLSSLSDDDYSSDELKSRLISADQAVLSSDFLIPEDASAQSNGDNLRVVATSPTLQSQGIYEPSLLDPLDESRMAFAVQNIFDISGVASTSHVCNISRGQNVSCMSESSSTCATETNPNFTSQELYHSSEFTCLFDLNISSHVRSEVDMNNADDNTELSKRLESHVSTADVDTVFLQGNHEDKFFQNDEEYGSSQYQFVNNIVNSHEVTSVSKTWEGLRSCEQNLKLLSPNSKDVSLVVRLASGLADFISEADIMFSSCNPLICDDLEPKSIPCVEPDSFSWYDDQVKMGSTVAQHGICLYTMKIASVGSGLGCNNTFDLAQEMLICSTSSTALGKLITQESFINHSSCFKDSDLKKTALSSMPIERESVSDLHNVILPIVPARLSMVLKGVAFHEYLSFISQISRFECSRLTGSLMEKQKRRSRARMHYLCSGAHQLSSEQAELLAQRCCFKTSRSAGNTNTTQEADETGS